VIPKVVITTLDVPGEQELTSASTFSSITCLRRWIMSNYTMDVDVAKVGCPVPKMDEVKKELLISMNELYARGLKTSCQW